MWNVWIILRPITYRKAYHRRNVCLLTKKCNQPFYYKHVGSSVAWIQNGTIFVAVRSGFRCSSKIEKNAC